MTTPKKLMLSGGEIDWSTVAIGDFVAGGYYFGRITFTGLVFALIVSPSAQGASSGRQWKTDLTYSPGTNDYDGKANTDVLASLSGSHPAAAFCKALNINGYSDWYLPARNELEILYRNLKPSTNTNHTSSGSNLNSIPTTSNYTTLNPAQTTVEIFKSGGSQALGLGRHWCSSEYDSYRAYCQSFTNGEQFSTSSLGYTDKTAANAVRAIRRELITS